jgi:hypothetical protein
MSPARSPDSLSPPMNMDEDNPWALKDAPTSAVVIGKRRASPEAIPANAVVIGKRRPHPEAIPASAVVVGKPRLSQSRNDASVEPTVRVIDCRTMVIFITR